MNKGTLHYTPLRELCALDQGFPASVRRVLSEGLPPGNRLFSLPDRQQSAPSHPREGTWARTNRLGVMNRGGIGDSHGLGNQGIVEEGFEAAKTFLGARSGFVFKKGLWGVGYYPDLTKDAQPRRPHKPPDGVVRPSASRCHYEVLGVATLAGEDELRRAYRQMALKVRAGV